MAEIDVNQLVQDLLGNEEAAGVRQQLLGQPPPQPGVNVGQSQGGQLDLTAADVITPAGAPAGGEVDTGLPTISDPSRQFLSPEEFDFLLRQDHITQQMRLDNPLVREQIQTRGVDPRDRAQQRFNEMLLDAAAPTVPTAKVVGEVGLTGVAPGVGTAAGGLLAARLIGRFFPTAARAIGTARLAGASAGSVAGSEANQLLGLEADESFNTVVAGLTPLVGAGISRVARKLASATGSGRSVRAARSGEILEDTVLRVGAPNVERELGETLPQLVRDRAFLPDLIDESFNAARAGSIDMASTVQAWRRFNPRQREQIIEAVGNANPEVGEKLRRLMDAPDLPVPIGQAGAATPSTFSGEELIRMREGLSDTIFALPTEVGKKQAAARREARELTEALKIFDEITEQDPIGLDNLTGVRLTRISKGMDALSDHINGVARSRLQGQFVGKEFDVARLINDVSDARTRLQRGKSGKDDPLRSVAELLENPRAFNEWRKSMTRIKRLANNNNIQIFSQSFGPVTRTAQLAGDVIGAKAMGEIMVSPVGRALLENVLKINGGQMTAPIMATLLSVSRALTTGQLDEVDETVIDLLGQAEDAVRPQLGFSLQQGDFEPGQRQQPQLSAPPPTQLQFGR